MPDTHVNDVNKGASGLDKFYTISSVSQTCLTTIGRLYEWASWDLVVEPSAGNGSFLLQIPTSKDKKIGLDISPDHADVVNKNFFEYAPPPDIGLGLGLGNILVVGNPPFGKARSRLNSLIIRPNGVRSAQSRSLCRKRSGASVFIIG